MSVNISTYTEKNPHTASMTRSGTARCPTLMGRTALGWIRRVISRLPCFRMSNRRITFMPPAVEPAQPPVNEPRNNKNGSTLGQTEWSAMLNPVVVTMDTVAKMP